MVMLKLGDRRGLHVETTAHCSSYTAKIRHNTVISVE